MVNGERDKHSAFVNLVLRADEGDTSDLVMAARRHVVSCQGCQERLPVETDLLRSILWSDQQSL